MKNICLYFQVHQPFRLNRFSFMDIGNGVPYYDEMLNSEILRQVSLQSYLPANRALMKLIKAGNRQLHVNFSISGTALDQFERYMPELIESFRALADTGCVEFMSDTYSHSLAALKSSEEFNLQVKKHTARVAALFRKTPRVFRNTEQIYNNKIADMAAAMGFVATLTNGASPENKIINLFIDYQTFGKFHEHADVISTFAQYLPNEILLQNNHLLRPEGVTKLLPAVASLMRPQITIPQEENYDLRPWLNNDMQQDAFDTLYALGKKVRATDDDQLKQDWAYLQSADHFYYMGIQDPGNSLSPYDSPFDAFINYMNVLTDFSLRTDNSLEKKKITPHGRHTLEAGLYI